MPTKAYSFRIPDDVMARINAALARRIDANQPEQSLSEFVVKALTERLDHLDRSRKSRRKAARRAKDELPELPELLEPTLTDFRIAAETGCPLDCELPEIPSNLPHIPEDWQ